MDFFIVNYNNKIDEKILVKKIKKKISTYSFCLIKRFNTANTQKKILNILKKRFSNGKDIRSSGPLRINMKDYQRLDVGDAYKNTRFIRIMTFTERQKKNYEFFKLINPVIKIRNAVSNVSKFNLIYPGLSSIAPLKNKGKYHFCDFVRMIQYPRGGGFLEQHHDHDRYYSKGVLPAILSVTAKKNNGSKKFNTYEEGGLYFVYKKKKIEIDKYVESGDLVLFNPKIHHGINSIDPKKNVDLTSINGRITIAFSIAKFLRK